MADPRHPRRFTEEFKRQIVQLYENGRPAMEIETECGILGVAKSTCYWMLDRPETEWADPHGEDVGRVWRDGDRSAEDSCHKGGKSGLTRRLLNHPIRLFPQ